MISEATIQFPTLDIGDGKRLWMLSDAVPNGFDESDTRFHIKAQDLFKLGWTHAPKVTLALARMQSVRMTAAWDRTRLVNRRSRPRHRRLQ